MAFCEIDESARKVLKKHWPDVSVFEDIKTLSGHNDMLECFDTKNKEVTYLHENIDVICGGFPCQDISTAGKQKGLEGERSGLWKEYLRLIKEIRPRYVIVENVANLRSKGLNQVLKDIWKIGYGCEWHILSAANIGAVHPRERTWIIAYPNSSELRESTGRRSRKSRREKILTTAISEDGEAEITNPLSTVRLWKPFTSKKAQSKWWSTTSASLSDWPKAEPPICGVDDGLPRELDKLRRERIKQLGNAVVPQIPELIGRAIAEHEGLL